jgi:hypothetical protein
MMSAHRLFRRSPVFYFSLLVVALVIAVVNSRLLRRLCLAHELRYVPRESLLLLSTGDLDSLWRNVEAQFRGIGRASGEPGSLVGQVREIKQSLAKKGIPVETLADLRRYGIDTARGLLFSLPVEPKGALLVVPLRDAKAFRAFLEKASGERPMPRLLTSGQAARKYAVTAFGDVLMAHPVPGIAVLSSSEGVMRRSLFLQDENWEYALSDGVLFGGIRRVLRRPMMRGATVFLSLRDAGTMLGAGSATLGDAAAALEVDAQFIRLRAELKVVSGAVKAVDDLIRKSSADAGWRSRLPAQTAALFTLQSGSFRSLLPFLTGKDGASADSDAKETEPPGTEAKQDPPPSTADSDAQQGATPAAAPETASSFGELAEILNSLSAVPGARQLVVAVLGFRQGLPEVVIGIGGSAEELRDLVFRLQRSLRTRRDRNLLMQAVKKARGRQPGAGALTAGRLLELGLLENEPHSLLGRYQISPRDQVGDAALVEQDFRNSSYERAYKREILRYLAPPVTPNDLHYQSFDNAEERAAFASDRYRMASRQDGDLLWVATEVETLEEQIDRTRGSNGKPDLKRNARFGRAGAGWRDTDKLDLFLDLERIVALGLLSPEGGLNEDARNIFLDLRQHSYVSLRVEPRDDKERLSMTAELARRSAEEP